MLLEKGLAVIVKNSNKEGPTLGIIIAAAILTIGTLLMDSYTKGIKKVAEPVVVTKSLEYKLIETQLQNCLTEKEFIVKMHEMEDQFELNSSIKITKPLQVDPIKPDVVLNTPVP